MREVTSVTLRNKRYNSSYTHIYFQVIIQAFLQSQYQTAEVTCLQTFSKLRYSLSSANKWYEKRD